jgi:hypothetical protein
LEMRLGCKGFIYPALTIFFPFYADVDFCMWVKFQPFWHSKHETLKSEFIHFSKYAGHAPC